MLYLLRSDGTVEELLQAVRAEWVGDWLICYDERHNEVARYEKRSVSTFSEEPLPVPQDDEARQEGTGDEPGRG